MSEPSAAAKARTAAHCKRVGIDSDRMYAALRTMGRDRLHKPEMPWSSGNPTQNYCYVASEWLHRFYMPDGSQTFRVDVDGDPYGHRFNILPDGSIIDVAAEQFLDKTIPYWEAKPFTFMQTGGPQPSWRAQMLQHVYNGGQIDGFQAEKQGEWNSPLTPKDNAEALLKDWADPYPKPVQAGHGGFIVVREDLLMCGSKARFVDALVSTHPHIDEWVFGSCPAQGWAQVSLSEVCARHGKQAHYFMAQRSEKNYTREQRAGIRLGGIYHWVPNGMLPVTQARAREYAAEKANRMVLPIGLEHPTVFAAIIKVAHQLKGEPKEIWSVASSGSLSRGLQMAFPKAKVHAVSVGHGMSEREIGRAKFYRSPLKFQDSVPFDERPPYPSVSNYDAKVWAPAANHGAGSGAWIWNVAADLPDESATPNNPTEIVSPMLGVGSQLEMF